MFDGMVMAYRGSSHEGGMNSYDESTIMYKFIGSFWPNCEPLTLLFPDSNYATYGDHYRVMECIISLPI